MIESLKIDSEFEHLIPPLVDDEFDLLEKNILAEGEIYTPLFVWNGFIIDGHHRYRILCKHDNIKFSVVEKEFENKYEAMSWMCNNQLGRRNLTPENKKYLIGMRYDAEKCAHGSQKRFHGEENSPSDTKYHLEDSNGKTRKKLSKEYGVSEAYVQKANQFAKGVDAAEEAVPGIKKEILTGKIKKSAKEIAEIAKAPQEQRRTLAENLRLNKQYDKKPANFNQNIKSISAEMRDLSTPVTDESVLETLQGAVKMFIESCESTFINHPNILVSEENCQKAFEILEKAKEYINNLKEINNNAKNKSENNT